MSTFLTSKQILLSYDVLAPKDLKGKVAKRGTSYEFQDYAYRLASDLNDLEHLQIYMMLAKTVPRYILDRTFEFAGDYNMDSRTKLFMWKLKQVRQEIKLAEELKNFDYKFVMKKSSNLIDKLAKKILEKNKTENVINTFLTNNKIVSKRSLLFGCSCHDLTSNILVSGSNLTALDLSANLIEESKKNFERVKKLKFFKTDFLRKKLKPDYFDLVIFNNTWSNIPLEAEIEVIKKLTEVIEKKGKVVLNYNPSNEDVQSWNKVMVEGEEKYYFEKKNKVDLIDHKFLSNGFTFVNKFESQKSTVLVFEK